MSKYIYIKNIHKNTPTILNVTKFKELDTSIIKSEHKEKKIITVSVPADGTIYQFLNDELFQKEFAIHKNYLKDVTNEVEKVLSTNSLVKELQDEIKALKDKIQELQDENKALKK